MGLAMLTIWACSMIESTMTLARRDGAGRIILATMGGGLVMNSSIPTAFATGAWGFVVPMVLIQVGRSLAARHYDVYDELRAHRPAMAAWSLLSAVPWVLGALAAPGPRLAWWVLALGIDLLGTRLGHPVPWNRDNDLSEVRFDIEHQASRTRRLLLICLGQAIVTTGSALSGDVRDPARVATALASLAVPIGPWHVFFDAVDVDPQKAHDDGARSEVEVGSLSTSWVGVLLLAVVVLAVASKKVVGTPAQAIDLPVAACLVAGPAVCLVARSLYLGRVTTTAGAVVLLALGAVATGIGLAQGVVLAGCALVIAITALIHARAVG